MPQHESHLVQIANFTFSAMIGVLILLIVGFHFADQEVVFEGGVPNVEALVMPAAYSAYWRSSRRCRACCCSRAAIFKNTGCRTRSSS